MSFFREAWIVGGHALCLLVESNCNLAVLCLREAAVLIKHVFALFFVAICGRPFDLFGKCSVYVAHRIIARCRRHHEVPAEKSERGGVAEVVHATFL